MQSHSSDGSSSSLVFPPVLTGSSEATAAAAAASPVCNSSRARHARKLQTDVRIQLEPIKLGLLSPRKSTELLPPNALELLANDHERMMKETQHALNFYKALASLRFRHLVGSEHLFLRAIGSILVSTCQALQADVVSLYAVDELNRQLTISSSSLPGLSGFKVPLGRFALRKVLESSGADTSQVLTTSSYVVNLQQSELYEATSDLDSRSGMKTVSAMASTIWDEFGKPVFVLEARATREMVFSLSMFAAALTGIENAVCQYDLTQELLKKQTESDELDGVLRQTLEPVDAATGGFNNAADPHPPMVESPAEEEQRPLQQQALDALLSPDINQLLTKLAHVSSFECCYLLSMKEEFGEVLVSKAACGFGHLNGKTEQEVDLFDVNKLLDVKTARSHDGTNALTESAQGFRGCFMKSVEQFKPVDLSRDEEVRDCFVDQSRIGSIVLLPLPRGTKTTSVPGVYYGVLCMTANAQHEYDLRTLKPFLSTLSLANLIVKKNEDMRASTHQKDKLIALYNAHFLVDNISDPSVLVNMICSIGADIFDTKRVTLYVADPIKKELWSLSNLGSVNGLRIPFGTGIAGTCAQTRERLIVRDPYNDSRFDPSFDIKFGFRTESLMTFPILDRNGEGEVLGVVQAVNSRSLQLESTKHKHHKDLILLFEAKVLDVYNHMVAYALRANSSLIMFAKVQSDYHIAHHNDKTDDLTHASGASAASEVATVHSLLDVHGFDDSKRVSRGPWITFAFMCACVGRFMLHLKKIRKPQHHQQHQQPPTVQETPGTQVDEAESRTDSMLAEPSSRVGTRRSMSEAIPSSPPKERRMMRHNDTGFRSSSLITRWRRASDHFASLGDDICSLEFDVFSKTALELVGFSVRLFEGLSLIDTFRIDEGILRTFIMNLASKYRHVPYHSFNHGFDVAQSCFVMIRRTRVFEIIKEYEALCLIIAGLGHDADHPGNDNQFEIDTSSSLALCYNDMSVLENHHAATTFEVLRQAECNFLKDMSAVVRSTIRGVVVRCILATDMKNHSKHLSELAVVTNVSDFETITDGRQLLLSTIIHCSDLGSMARPLPIALQWVDRVCQEFSDQARKSEELGINVPKHLMHLENEKPRAMLQVNFINYVVLPLWNTVVVILPEVRPQIEYITTCLDHYAASLRKSNEETTSS